MWEQTRHTLSRGGVHQRVLEQVLVRGQRAVEVEDLVLYLVRAVVLAVHLVQDNDGLLGRRKRFAEHELRLSHRPLRGVHQ